jgi:hypothetical protein
MPRCNVPFVMLFSMAISSASRSGWYQGSTSTEVPSDRSGKGRRDIRHEEERAGRRIVVAEMVLEQPGRVVAELLAQRAVRHYLAIERLVRFVDVARRGRLKSERNVSHRRRFLFVVPDYIKRKRSWGGPDGPDRIDDDKTLRCSIGIGVRGDAAGDGRGAAEEGRGLYVQ